MKLTYFLPTGEWPLWTAPYHILLSSMGFSKAKDGELLVLPGGADIGVRLQRDDYESRAYFDYFDSGRPILAICRGAQLICHIRGGSLIQELFDWKEEIQHNVIAQGRTGTSSFHWIRGKQDLYVNSRHHQGFLDMPGSEVTHRSDDGLAEMGFDHSVFWTQWHPEHPEMQKSNSLSIFKDLFSEWHSRRQAGTQPFVTPPANSPTRVTQ